MNLLIHFTKTGAMSTPTAFIEDLIDACVMQWEKRLKYEGRMMKWRLLSGAFSSFILHNSFLWHAPVARLLDEAHTKARSHEEEKGKSDSPSLEFLRAFASSCETSPIRNRLLRLTTDCPDLLAIIKEEGFV
jgi:hypothetical protein